MPNLKALQIVGLITLLFGAMLRSGQPVAVQFLPQTIGPLSAEAHEQLRRHRLDPGTPSN